MMKEIYDTWQNWAFNKKTIFFTYNGHRLRNFIAANFTEFVAFFYSSNGTGEVTLCF